MTSGNDLEHRRAPGDGDPMPEPPRRRTFFSRREGLLATGLAIALAAVVIAAVLANSSSSAGGGGATHTSVPTPTSAPVSVSSSAPTPVAGGLTAVGLSRLDGARVPTTFRLVDDTSGVTQAKFYLTTNSTKFLTIVHSAPFQATITVPVGPNSIQVRHVIGGVQSRVQASFVAVAGATSGPGVGKTSAGRSSTVAAPPADVNTAPLTKVPAMLPATVSVSSSAQLANALKKAGPGTVIRLADGTYQNDGGDRWELSASGTADQPIVLEGGRGAVIESDSTSGDYGLWITGSYWKVLGLSVRNATKGIVLDGSQHTVIDGVEVGEVGEEGVHFRSCSSDGVLENSYVHDTGLQKPQYGEASYVGSANSNWDKYGCAGGRDASEHDVIRDNLFRHIAAEGADLKEGTDSGTLSGNTFLDTGYSGENSADSAVDVKGNGWTIADNVVAQPDGADQDGFQTHTVYDGYGTNNTFTGNVVLGHWPGFGIGLYPQAGNVVACSNKAPQAAKGLVGDGHTAVACSG